MNHRPVPRPPDTVRVVVEDVPDIEERVRTAARRAREVRLSLELVQRGVATDDHEARACLIRRMDEALAIARQAAPGVDIRVGVPIEQRHPRSTS